MSNRVAPMQLNASVIDTEASRERQQAAYRRAVKMAEAAVWRRQRAFDQCRKPDAKRKAERKLQAAKDALQNVVLFGSKPSKGMDVIQRQRMMKRRAARAKPRPEQPSRTTG